MKNAIKLILLSFISIYFMSCNSQKYTAWQYDVKKDNLNFDKIRYAISKDGKDTLSIECVLKNMSVIDGFPCSAGEANLTKDWKLKSFVLGQNLVMSGNTIPVGTYMRIYKDKLLCMFPNDTEIQTYLCGGSYNKMGTEGIHTSLYRSGKLKVFFPVNDVMIDNVLCKSSPFAGVYLYESGKLRKCKLAKDQTIGGVDYKRNTELSFDEDGNIIKD